MVTINTESIGSASRDRVDVAAWEAALPANLITSDTQEIGECFNDSEFTSTSVILIESHVTDATRDVILRAASGEGFADTGDGTAWRYIPANGAAVRKTNGTGFTLRVRPSMDFFTLDGIQWSNDGGSYGAAARFAGDNNRVNNGVFSSNGREGGRGTLTLDNTGESVNNLIVVTSSSNSAKGLTLGVYYDSDAISTNDTVIKPSDISGTGTGVTETNGAGNVVKGALVLGFGTAFSGTFASGSDWNVTDDSSAPGGNSTTSVTFADTIENTVEATLDARLKTGSAALNAAAQFSETNDLDAFGNARDTSTPDAGAHELQVAAAGASQQLLLIGVG